MTHIFPKTLLRHVIWIPVLLTIGCVQAFQVSPNSITTNLNTISSSRGSSSSSSSSSGFLTYPPLPIPPPPHRSFTLIPSTFTTTVSQATRGNGNFFDDISSNSDSYYEGSSKDRITASSSDANYNPLNLDVPQSPTEAYASLSPEEFEEHVPKINSVTLVGRIGQNPEPRYFDDGKVVLRLGLAVKRKYHPLERQAKNIKYGEEETNWFNLELWGRDAEYATKYVTKGARVGVTGSLNVDSWVDRMTGEEKTSAKILVKQLDILETKAEAELRQQGKGGGGYRNSSYRSDSDDNKYYGRNDSDYGDGPSSGGSGGFFDD